MAAWLNLSLLHFACLGTTPKQTKVHAEDPAVYYILLWSSGAFTHVYWRHVPPRDLLYSSLLMRRSIC